MMMSIDFIGTEKSIWSINAIFLLFLFSQPKLSSVSVVFNFNASLNDVTPLPPKQLPVYLIRMGEWIVDGCHFCVVFFCAPLRSSFVIALFNFSASLKDAAPVFPMLLSVDMMIIGKIRVFMGFICALFVFLFTT